MTTGGREGGLLNHRLDGYGRPLVLLHPVGLDLTCFDALVAELDDDFRILRVDLRGHGRSPLARSRRELADYAADVHAVQNSMGFLPSAIVGFSFGGMVAQTLAIEHPTDVTALVVSACPSTLPDEARLAFRERGRAAERGGMAAIVEPTLERWFNPEFRSERTLSAIRERLLRNDAGSWAEAWRAISLLDTKPRLASIRAPALCLAGERDASVSPRALEEMADGIPRARFVILPGAPHMLFIEQPREVAASIRAFLDEALPAA